MSSPAVGVSVPPHTSLPESPSMGSMQLPSSSCTIQTPQQQQQQQQPLPAPPLVASTSSAAAAAAAATQKASACVSDVAQDNSITSEPSETTTTTTTTSEDVVTTYKETSQLSASNGVAAAQTVSGNGNGGGSGAAATASATAAASGGSAASSAAHKPHNGSTAGSAAGVGAASSSAAHDDQLSLSLSLSQGADSVPDKSEASDDGDCNGCGNNVVNNSADNSQALDESIESPSRSHRMGSVPGLALGAGSSSNGRGQLKVESSDVYQIVDALRRNTNLSFDLSCEALRVVLTSLEQLYNGAINPYLEAVAVHVTGKVATPKELLGITHDSKRLQYLFGQLADCKNDTEQRTWMLYEDEEDIIQFLEELVEILVRGRGHNMFTYVLKLICLSCSPYRTTRTRTSAATKCPAISIRCSSTWCSTIRWRHVGPSNASCSRLSQLPVTWITSLLTFYLPQCCLWRL